MQSCFCSSRGDDGRMKKMSVAKLIFSLTILLLTGCASVESSQSLPTRLSTNSQPQPALEVSDHYVIGPGDNLSVFVWGNPDLSASVPVRPDGMITTPLVEDVEASGNTPTQLARIMESRLSKYVKNPVVTVTVTSFNGRYDEQVRVIGEAAKPQALNFRENMTVLDVVIAVGGLTENANGNDAKIVRAVDGKQKVIRVRLSDLIKKGDISANTAMRPGDILIIPESWF